jgi:hypothetical protein
MENNDNFKLILNKSNKRKDGSFTVYIEVNTSSGKRLRKSTGITVLEKNWRGQYPKFIGPKDIDFQLKNQQLLEKLEAIRGGISSLDKRPSFFEFFKQFIRENDPNVGKLRRLEYRRTCEHLLVFEEEEKYPIDWETINVEFFNRFRSFLSSLNYGTNYQIKFFKIIKQVMKLGNIRGVHTNLSFQERGWRLQEEEYESVYLNEKEINQIEITKVAASLQKSKDWLLIGCYLGLRFEDLMSLSKENIRKHQGKDVIRVQQSKTKELVVIPIKPLIVEILKKYDGFPPRLANAYFNRSIKIICRTAGLKDADRVMAHTMRRSFATNCYLAGIPSIGIMKITGHKTESAFLRYIKVTKEESAIQLSENPFFS